jgi:hypothetical protein
MAFESGAELPLQAHFHTPTNGEQGGGGNSAALRASPLTFGKYQNMKIQCLAFLCLATFAAAEQFPEIPEGPIEKVQAWKILDQQWRIIEPLLFTEAGKAHIDRSVRFDSQPVTIGKPLIVRTASGTTASVWNIPKWDMDLIREFHKPPKNITIEGILTAIDPDKKTITIKAFGVRPNN